MCVCIHYWKILFFLLMRRYCSMRKRVCNPAYLLATFSILMRLKVYKTSLAEYQIIIHLSMVMRDIGSSHCPKPECISRGAARGHGKCLYPEITIFNCFIVPIQYIYTQLFALVELLYEHMNL